MAIFRSVFAASGRPVLDRDNSTASENLYYQHSMDSSNSMIKYTYHYILKCLHKLRSGMWTRDYIHVLMRDEKEGRKKQARSNKQQGKATQHTQGSHLYSVPYMQNTICNPPTVRLAITLSCCPAVLIFLMLLCTTFTHSPGTKSLSSTGW